MMSSSFIECWKSNKEQKKFLSVILNSFITTAGRNRLEIKSKLSDYFKKQSGPRRGDGENGYFSFRYMRDLLSRALFD